MRNTIFGFNQQKAIELNLSVNDLLLLNYIQTAHANPKMKHIVVDEVSYVFLSHSKIHEDIPILSYTEGTLKNKLLQFKKQNILDSQLHKTPTGGTMAYYSLTKFATEQLFEEYSDVIYKLPQRSSQSDVRGHSEVTSYNNLDNIELEDKENIILKNNTAEPSIRNSGKRFNPNLTDDVSDKSYDDVPVRKKKMNLYEKCQLEITNFTDDENLREALKTYLDTRLRIKDKPILGIGQWKGLLNTLSRLQGDKVKIVERATERGWASFFELKDYQYNKQNDIKRSVFAEDYGVKSVRPEDVEGGGDSGIKF